MTVIDISKWNGNIDFAKLKTQVDGVIIRIGYRGYGSAGTIVRDGYEVRNIKGCIEHDIPYGVYFFSQAVNYEEGKREAEYTLNKLKEFGTQPLLPVFIDTEGSGASGGNGRADNISKEARTDAMRGFCEAVERAGYWAGIYASTSWFSSHLNDSELLRWSHWVADYRGSCGYTGAYVMWQYTSGGAVAGIAGRTDMNIAYVDFPKIVREQGLNGYGIEIIVDIPEEKIEAISSDLIKLVIGQASAGDVAKFVDRLKTLEIDWTENDGYLYTGLVSKGDQITLLKLGKELGVEVKQYAEVTVIAETTQDYKEEPDTSPVEPDKDEFSNEERNIIIKIIRFLIRLIGGLE